MQFKQCFFRLVQFSGVIKDLDEKLAYVFQQRFENKIEEKFPAFEQSNEEKRNDFIVCNEIIDESRVFMTLIFGSNISKRQNFSSIFERH